MRLVAMHQVNTVSDPAGVYSVTCLQFIQFDGHQLKLLAQL